MSDFMEPKSAREVMMMQSQAYQKITNVLNEKAISRKRLSGATKFSYCPFCMERLKRGGLNYQQELRPLWYVTYKMACQASAEYIDFIFESRYECDVCKVNGKPREITYDDFINFYAEKPKDLAPRDVKITPKVLEMIERGAF